MHRVLTFYYAATVIFLIADYFFGINVRIAFLDGLPQARLAYYLVCFACLAVMIWRPDWQAVVSAAESLAVIVALILAMGVRVMVISDTTLESGRAIVTTQEILNFLISGSVAYYAWFAAIRRLKSSKLD